MFAAQALTVAEDDSGDVCGEGASCDESVNMRRSSCSCYCSEIEGRRRGEGGVYEAADDSRADSSAGVEDGELRVSGGVSDGSLHM